MQRGGRLRRQVLERLGLEPSEHAGGVQRERERAARRSDADHDEEQRRPDELGYRAERDEKPVRRHPERRAGKRAEVHAGRAASDAEDARATRLVPPRQPRRRQRERQCDEGRRAWCRRATSPASRRSRRRGAGTNAASCVGGTNPAASSASERSAPASNSAANDGSRERALAATRTSAASAIAARARAGEPGEPGRGRKGATEGHGGADAEAVVRVLAHRPGSSVPRNRALVRSDRSTRASSATSSVATRGSVELAEREIDLLTEAARTDEAEHGRRPNGAFPAVDGVGQELGRGRRQGAERERGEAPRAVREQGPRSARGGAVVDDLGERLADEPGTGDAHRDDAGGRGRARRGARAAAPRRAPARSAARPAASVPATGRARARRLVGRPTERRDRHSAAASASGAPKTRASASPSVAIATVVQAAPSARTTKAASWAGGQNAPRKRPPAASERTSRSSPSSRARDLEQRQRDEHDDEEGGDASGQGRIGSRRVRRPHPDAPCAIRRSSSSSWPA